MEVSVSFKVTKYENHLGTLREKFGSAVDLALESIGSTAERHAKEQCPRDTGRLRNSITYTTKKMGVGEYSYSDDNGQAFSMEVGSVDDDYAVHIGSSVEYAAPVEFREIKHDRGNAHFLRNAVAQHNDEFARIIAGVLDGITF